MKSVIARPRMHETVLANQPYTVLGAAWGGESTSPWSKSASTEVALGGGGFPRSGVPLRVAAMDVQLDDETPGRYTLLSSARAADGTVQPVEHDARYGSYVINHLLPIEVVAESAEAHV
jgi:hypothetical protein